MRSTAALLCLLALASVLLLVNGDRVDEKSQQLENANLNVAAADSLLAVDAGAEHSNETPRLARQFGFFGPSFPYYGGGGGFGRPFGFGGRRIIVRRRHFNPYYGFYG